MGALVLVRKDCYYDSVLLMRLSQALRQLPGVEDAAVVMGTPANLDLLEASGHAAAELVAARPNDLVIAVRGAASAGQVEAAFAALVHAERPAAAAEIRPRTLGAALAAHPEANLVLISVPGEHAAREARRALALGRHVMIFSDNVAIADEVALKCEAVRRGLLLMGPDCGTAIINGKPLGFANAVRRGPIGVIGAAGTGIQEVTSCIHRLGGGISQAIGVGGRDLSAAVGGLMTLLAIEALAADPATAALVVISKPPAPTVARAVVAALAAAGKPGVVHFVGAPPGAAAGAPGIAFADSLAEAARLACRLVGLGGSEESPSKPDEEIVAELARRLWSGVKLRGLFCGGTTGAEALAILARGGLRVRSNLHHAEDLAAGGEEATGHLLLDLGGDDFTRGRPHPMIEPALRNERLAVEMADAEVGLLLFDLVLGHGAHRDPAGVLAEGIAAAREAARSRGRDLTVIVSITGTEEDPQVLSEQRRTLLDAGVVVAADNCAAALLAAALLRRIQ
ncbi:MAG: acyl-CoA synthetase FdrA [Acidobacteriota bacterium]